LQSAEHAGTEAEERATHLTLRSRTGTVTGTVLGSTRTRLAGPKKTVRRPPVLLGCTPNVFTVDRAITRP
jgi:hypothetical protein